MLDCMPRMLHVHCHNYRQLIRRWRSVARRNHLQMQQFAQASAHPIYSVRNKTMPLRGGIYISAGIHGDEAGATEGLIGWAEQTDLSGLPILILPCLNPWGLIHNNRLDQTGEDLNRLFHHEKNPVVAALKTLIAPYQFSMAVSLHEDYDSMGIYLYEIEGQAPFLAEDLLAAAQHFIGIEPRKRIDGRRFKAGVMRQKLDLRKFRKLGGHPESIYLHRFHSERTFTFETPSEFSLERRIEAHVAFLNEATRRVTCEGD